MSLEILLPLFLGFSIGMMTKRKPKPYLFWTSLSILLFFVGHQMGSTVSNLGALYEVLKSAFVVAIFAIFGSVVSTLFVWRRIFK